MNLKEIEKTCINEPKFRLKQIYQAVFCDLIESWDEATNLSLNLRKELNEKSPLKIDGEILESNKKNIKAVIKLADGNLIETVLMQHKDGRNTVCLSSQVRCPLGCKFCATGKSGFVRNLEVEEILEQVFFMVRYLKKKARKISGVVFMGMGEPFLNYENVMHSIKILNDKEKFNLGARHISISTVGLTEGINKLADEKMQINLAVSLHASNDNLREELMPIAKKYSINKILKSVDNYIKKTNRRVMFEYMLIKDVNDSMKDAENLARIMNKKLYLVNLINYNPTGVFEPSDRETVNRFKIFLEKKRVQTTLRYSFGKEVKGACGQLTKNFIKK
jgi:23S rRNA (adenine2503-C2)-methyltransferase